MLYIFTTGLFQEFFGIVHVSKVNKFLFIVIFVLVYIIILDNLSRVKVILFMPVQNTPIFATIVQHTFLAF